MLTGLLSCFEGGGLALLQPGRLGTTPTYSTCINAYSTPKDSVCFIDMEIDCTFSNITKCVICKYYQVCDLHHTLVMTIMKCLQVKTGELESHCSLHSEQLFSICQPLWT